jgi:hypothetical protein
MAGSFRIAEAFVELTSKGAVAEQIQKQIRGVNSLQAAYQAQKILYADTETVKQLAITKTLEKEAQATKHYSELKAGAVSGIQASPVSKIPFFPVEQVAAFRAHMILAQEGVAKFGDKISGLRNIAAFAFGGITASIVGTVAVSNPATFAKFQMAIEQVAGVIGMMFAPILEKVTELIKNLAGWIYSMSAGTKTAIVAITVGVAILAGGFLVLTAAVWIVNTALIAFNTLTGGVLFIIGAVVMAIGALAGGMVAASTASAGWTKVMAAFDSIAARVSVALDYIAKAFNSIGITGSDVFSVFLAIIEKMIDALMLASIVAVKFGQAMYLAMTNPALLVHLTPAVFADAVKTEFDALQAEIAGAIANKKAAPIFNSATAGSVADVQKTLQVAAFKVPVEQQQLDKLGDIHKTLEEIVRNTMSLPGMAPVLN